MYSKLPIVLLKTDKSIIKYGDDLKVILSVKSKKSSIVKFPDIKEIAGYGIKSKRDSSIVVKDDNKDVVIKLATYTITPTESFTIPSYEIVINNKSYKTKPHEITVVKSKHSNSNSGFIFKMSSSKYNVVVSEPFVVTVELIEPIEVSSSDIKYQAPKFRGFKATALGSGEVEDKGDRVIRKVSYLLTPINPGKYIIKPAVAKIAMQFAPQAQTPFAFFGSDIQWKQIKSNSITINVKSKPDSVNLVGKYKISAKVDKTKVRANKPVNLILQIEGEGNIEDLEDPKFNIDNVTIFSKDSNIEHSFENSKVYSVYTKQYTFVSNSDFTIPSIRIKAYDPESKKLYTLSTKEIKIKISKLSTISSILSGVKDKTSSFIHKKDNNYHFCFKKHKKTQKTLNYKSFLCFVKT